VPAFTVREDDPGSFRSFVAIEGRNDEKTVAAYLTTLRDLAAWLATQPDGTPFHPALLTVTALEGYFAYLEAEQRAPRTRAKALTAITRFCRWAIAAGQLQRNPAHQIKRPTVPALSPTELAPEQRTDLKKGVFAGPPKRCIIRNRIEHDLPVCASQMRSCCAGLPTQGKRRCT